MTLIDLGQFARARRMLAYETPSVTHVAARGALLAARIARLLGASPAAELQRARRSPRGGTDYYIGALLDLEHAATLPARPALQLCDGERGAAETREYGGIAIKARLLAARATLEAGASKAAAGAGTRCKGRCRHCTRPTATRRTGGDRSRSSLANGEASRRPNSSPPRSPGSTTALPHAPDAYRESFLHRNPVNRALLTAASRLR